MSMLARRPHLTTLALLGFGAALLTAGQAAAQFDGGTVNTTLAKEDLFIGVQHVQGSNLSDFEVSRFFNKANCDCSADTFIFFALQGPGFAKRSAILASGTTDNIEFWVGQTCNDINFRAQRCQLLASMPLSTFLNASKFTAQTTARVLSTYTNPGAVDDAGVSVVTGVFPPDGNPTCTLPVLQYSQFLWALVGPPGSYTSAISREVLIDLTAPPSPDSNGITVEAGNEALVVSWPKVNSALYMDLQGYQILCNRGGSLQVFDDRAFTPGFLSCPATIEANGGGIAGLNPLFVCSPVLTPSATSYRVKILQNDIVYGVAVVSLDLSQNASTPDIFYGVPIKTKSFYDVYRDGNTGNTGPATPGGAAGGFCALGSARPARTPALAGAAALAALGIVVARRRRRR
jgi:hypothetical protein